MKGKVFRPHLDDVERLSYGKGAVKQRGTGSRFVCHRLNKQERTLFELAKHSGYLAVKGNGYRKERKGSPLWNIFRQRCDALKELCVMIEKRTDYETVVIDFSTLRVPDDTSFVSLILTNVLEAKYPALHSAVTKEEGAYTTILQKKSIDWDAVQTKPIWGVNERIISVVCDRDVAKALVKDVLNESSNYGDPDFEKLISEAGQNNSEQKTASADDEDNCIDWDDI